MFNKYHKFSTVNFTVTLHWFDLFPSRVWRSSETNKWVFSSDLILTLLLVAPFVNKHFSKVEKAFRVFGLSHHMADVPLVQMFGRCVAAADCTLLGCAAEERRQDTFSPSLNYFSIQLKFFPYTQETALWGQI